MNFKLKIEKITQENADRYQVIHDDFDMYFNEFIADVKKIKGVSIKPCDGGVLITTDGMTIETFQKESAHILTEFWNYLKFKGIEELS